MNYLGGLTRVLLVGRLFCTSLLRLNHRDYLFRNKNIQEQASLVKGQYGLIPSKFVFDVKYQEYWNRCLGISNSI